MKPIRKATASLIGLGAAGVLVALASMRSTNSDGPSAPAIDPAIEFHTSSHTATYGGIERWAYHGMKAESVVAYLRRDGYVCILPTPTVGNEVLQGVQEVRCDKQVRGPLARTLSVRASIDYDMRGRLVAASAESRLTGAAKIIAGILRKFGWIEPETLQVRGFEIDTADLLARRAVDALNPSGWAHLCRDETNAQACVEATRKRREAGFPALPQGAAPAGEAMRIQSAMEAIRLMPPVQRTGDELAGDTLLVRVTDGEMWLDFIGRDLAGRQMTVAISLASEGGAPKRLVATVDKQSKEIVLGGTVRRANSGAPAWLAPAAGAENPRAGRWLYMPNRALPATYRDMAETLPRSDPAFIPAIVKGFIATIAALAPPEEGLGLYPPLRSIEYRADALRLGHAERWFDASEATQWFRQQYADQPMVRAAFAMVNCEEWEETHYMRPECWKHFAIDDPEPIALIRGEAAQLQVMYSELETTHPVRLRLKRLSDIGK